MIDVISCSIRLGKYLRKIPEYKIIYQFYFSDTGKIIFSEYKQLLNKYFMKYGFYAFDCVDNLLKENSREPSNIGYSIAKPIMDFLNAQSNYKEIISISKELGRIVNEYINELMGKTTTFPIINVSQHPLKLQQISNELSTSILRTGVFKWVLNKEYRELFQKCPEFIHEYEIETEQYRTNYPYCKEIVKIIKGLTANQKKIAYLVENIELVRFLIRNGIIQGFFFEIFEIPESEITKIKEKNKDKSIYPVILKSNMIFPTNQLMIFKYTIKGKEKYLLARKIVTQFELGKFSMCIAGYCYPTNEYLLFDAYKYEK